VLDASAAVERLPGTDRGRRVAVHLRDQSLVAPELLDVEVASARDLLERQAVMDRADADGVVRLLAQLPVDRVPHGLLLPRAWALRPSIRTADAFYVACAQLCAASLLTCDARLARTASPAASITTVV
jgi:predicted nucleic acid-binding protein